MSKLNLAVLKRSLSECHLTSDDKKLKLLSDIKDPSYFLHRIMECISKCEAGEEVQENSKLGIQLFNLYRVKTCGPIQTEREQKGRPGSNNSTGDNSSPPGSGMGSGTDAR